MRGRWFIGVVGAWRYLYARFTDCPRYFFVAGPIEKQMSQEQSKIELTDELERFMALHGYDSVDEIKKLPVEELLKMDGFGWRLVKYIQKSTA